jgi:hypothetical protein
MGELCIVSHVVGMATQPELTVGCALRARPSPFIQRRRSGATRMAFIFHSGPWRVSLYYFIALLEHWKINCMSIHKTFLAVVLCLFCSAGFSLENVQAYAESRLVGVWQKGLTSELKRLPSEQAGKLGVLGDILVFKSNRTFQLYPRCGRPKEDLNQKGFESINGVWHIAEPSQLSMSVENKGKSLEQSIQLEFGESEMFFVSASGKRELFGRYEKELPQKCY